MSELESGFRVADVLALLRRRRRILLIACLIGVALAASLYVTAPARYAATARVQIGAPPGDRTTTSAAIHRATQADLMSSDVVGTLAIEELGIATTPRMLFAGLTVSTTGDSDVLRVTYEAASPEVARDRANAIAAAYVEASKTSETTATSGAVVGDAPLPKAKLSRAAVAKSAGVFGLTAMLGLAVALVIDRRDTLGGGRRRAEQLAPTAAQRVLPTARGSAPAQDEIDAAIDRLALDLAVGHSPGQAAASTLVSTRRSPPLKLATDLANSFTYSGISALIVIPVPTNDDVGPTHAVSSFAELLNQSTIGGPDGLPSIAGARAFSAPPKVTWLSSDGPPKASGLLRQEVTESLIQRAGAEGFEVVLFVAPSPARSAVGSALAQWTSRTFVIVDDEESATLEATIDALTESQIAITEVVWT